MKNHPFELIPLEVKTEGSITVNNLPEFREMVREALANVNRDLKTDEDFEQAEKDVKALKAAEDAVRAAALKMYDEKVQELEKALQETAEEFRVPRLELEKIIAKRKDELKADIVRQAIDALICAPRLRKPVFGKSIEDSVKGKRLFESMAKAAEVLVANHNATISKNRAMIDSFTKAHGAELVPDAEELETKSPESVEPELRRRFEVKKAAEERKRLEAEAAAARAAEAKAKAEAEAAKAAAQAPPAPAVDPRNPHNLPTPPKIGGIPTGANAAPPSNMMPSGGVVTVDDGPSESEEWAEITQTVVTAFGAIKEHRERLIHARNKERLIEFGELVNQAWNQCRPKRQPSA